MHAEPDSGAPAGRAAPGAPRSPLPSGRLKDDPLPLPGVLARILPTADATDHRNPSLASGSAGLFNRMYQLTVEQALADAARFGVGRTLELCATPARGASAPGESAPGAEASGTAAPGAAAPARVPLTAARPACHGSGLLRGAAGVALAWEAASTAAEPVWDQMLLVSSIEDPGSPAAMSGRFRPQRVMAPFGFFALPTPLLRAQAACELLGRACNSQAAWRPR